MLRLNTRAGRRSGRRFILFGIVAAAYLLGGQIRGPFTNVQVVVGECASEDKPRSMKLSESGDVLARTVRGRKGKNLGNHIYNANGLLEVNPEGPHPIYELVERVQEAWDQKLAKASKTLEEAVVEYQRRYKRPPLRGFDLWWQYVLDNNVQLPDEYDQIHRDNEPFWGVAPRDLQEFRRAWENNPDSFTIGKEAGDDPIAILDYSVRYGDDSRHGSRIRAIFNPHDTPNLVTNYLLKQDALRMAKQGRVLKIRNRPDHRSDGWLTACPPNALAQKEYINWGRAPYYPPASAPRVKSFIHDHYASMDPCQYPSHFLLHGQFIPHGKGPEPYQHLIPQFSFSPSRVHYDITPANPLNWINEIYPFEDNLDWEERWDARLQWRGSNTGIYYSDNVRWDLSHRSRLMIWAGDGRAEGELTMRRNVTVRKEQWVPAMLDIAFSGEPVNCDPNVCAELQNIFEYRKRHDGMTSGKYKYYIDSFKRLMTSKGLVFKTTMYSEWFMDRIAPWVHYIPIQNDLSNPMDALVFFRGDPVGNGAHCPRRNGEEDSACGA
ncbi:hypothetical protein D9619_010334 [Psilocybe cf. subviscida]|uniref:Glycosyl transferase CAP10 domain-containing protein n=1 Tax=Psilocybe cf. subviscida TaxID=2480587 RepID=A0A8H5ASH2_9AGAR|nr:hypothetical protein D9619_010334 [Psilocybe cf. subviscida]